MRDRVLQGEEEQRRALLAWRDLQREKEQPYRLGEDYKEKSSSLTGWGRITRRARDLQGEEEIYKERRARMRMKKREQPYGLGENYQESEGFTKRRGEEEIYKERRARMRMRMKKREQPCRLGEIYKESRIFQREKGEEVVDKKSPIFTKRKGAALQAGGGLQREEEGLTGWERITKRREEEFIKRERVL